MRRSDRDLVRALPLFNNVGAAHFDELMSASFLQRFPAQVELIDEGTLPDFLHIVIDGTVELYSRSADRTTTLEIIRPVTTFILAAVIRDEIYLKSARTLTAARILMIPATSVRDVFGRDAHFARAVVAELASRYRSLVRALKDQKLRTGVERLANWILEEDQRQGGHGRVVLTHEKRILSSRLGMTPENLSRNLASLSAHGIMCEGREILVSDRQALQRLAKPGPSLTA